MPRLLHALSFHFIYFILMWPNRLTGIVEFQESADRPTADFVDNRFVVDHEDELPQVGVIASVAGTDRLSSSAAESSQGATRICRYSVGANFDRQRALPRIVTPVLFDTKCLVDHVESEVDRATKLLENGHMSPFDHPAQAQHSTDRVGNLRGFKSARKFIPNEDNFARLVAS